MMRFLFNIQLFFVDFFVKVFADRSAVGFLTRQPSTELYTFARELANNSILYDLDILIVMDENRSNISNFESTFNFQLIHVNEKDCLEYGYQKSISQAPDIYQLTAWDKALYYFNTINKSHSFVWLIEDDVFIPSTRALLALHELYSNTTDVVSSQNRENTIGNTSNWWWFLVDGYLVPPWYSSMANIIGMSRRLLNAIDEYVRWRGLVPFHEIFINTLAMHLNYTVRTPFELKHLVFRNRYEFSMIKELPNDFWHPVKQNIFHSAWRKAFANSALRDRLLYFRLVYF